MGLRKGKSDNDFVRDMSDRTLVSNFPFLPLGTYVGVINIS